MLVIGNYGQHLNEYRIAKTVSGVLLNQICLEVKTTS